MDLLIAGFYYDKDNSVMQIGTEFPVLYETGVMYMHVFTLSLLWVSVSSFLSQQSKAENHLRF